MILPNYESPSLAGGSGCTALFTACGDRTRPDSLDLISPAHRTRLLTEAWVSHPDDDLPLFVPPGGEAFFDLIAPAVQRSPGVFRQR